MNKALIRSGLYICLIFLFFIPEDARAQKVSKEMQEFVKEMSHNAWSLRDTQADSALALGLEALALAEQHHLEHSIAQTSNFVGAIYSHYLYQYKISIPYFRKALEFSSLTKDSLQTAYAYNNLSFVYLAIGNSILALEYAEMAFQTFEQIGDKVGMAYGYTNMGIIYRDQNEFDKSLSYLQEASKIRKKLRLISRQGSSLYQIAKTYQEAGMLDSAFNTYQQALDHNKNTKHSRYKVLCLKGIGDVHRERGEYNTALEYYHQAIQWDEQRGDVYGLIETYIGVALTYAYIGNYEKGESFLNDALEKSLEVEIGAQIINSYNAYIEFYKIQGNMNKVAESFDMFLSQYDSILTVQHIEIINELEHNFSIRQDLLKKEEQLETNRTLRSRLLTIILLMIVIIAFILWQYISNQRINKQLANMNRTKDKLLSVISHDLKNPFNTLIGFSQLIQTKLEEKDYEQAKEFSTYLNRASNDGFNLLTTLLQWSMSQSGKIQYHPGHVNIPVLFKGLGNQFLTEIKKVNLNLSFENKVEQDITADPNILKIILSNLITNAIKYTSDGGQIDVEASIHEETVHIIVSDTGIGMSEETIQKLIDTKSDINSKKGLREEKGTGLGISIVQELIKLHKGSLYIHSEEGKGSTFKISFPLH